MTRSIKFAHPKLSGTNSIRIIAFQYLNQTPLFQSKNYIFIPHQEFIPLHEECELTPLKSSSLEDLQSLDCLPTSSNSTTSLTFPFRCTNCLESPFLVILFSLIELVYEYIKSFLLYEDIGGFELALDFENIWYNFLESFELTREDLNSHKGLEFGGVDRSNGCLEHLLMESEILETIELKASANEHFCSAFKQILSSIGEEQIANDSDFFLANQDHFIDQMLELHLEEDTSGGDFFADCGVQMSTIHRKNSDLLALESIQIADGHIDTNILISRHLYAANEYADFLISEVPVQEEMTSETIQILQNLTIDENETLFFDDRFQNIAQIRIIPWGKISHIQDEYPNLIDISLRDIPPFPIDIDVEHKSNSVSNIASKRRSEDFIFLDNDSVPVEKTLELGITRIQFFGEFLEDGRVNWILPFQNDEGWVEDLKWHKKMISLWDRGRQIHTEEELNSYSEYRHLVNDLDEIQMNIKSSSSSESLLEIWTPSFSLIFTSLDISALTKLEDRTSSQDLVNDYLNTYMSLHSKGHPKLTFSKNFSFLEDHKSIVDSLVMNNNVLLLSTQLYPLEGGWIPLSHFISGLVIERVFARKKSVLIVCPSAEKTNFAFNTNLLFFGLDSPNRELMGIYDAEDPYMGSMVMFCEEKYAEALIVELAGNDPFCIFLDAQVCENFPYRLRRLMCKTELDDTIVRSDQLFGILNEYGLDFILIPDLNFEFHIVNSSPLLLEIMRCVDQCLFEMIYYLKRQKGGLDSASIGEHDIVFDSSHFHADMSNEWDEIYDLVVVGGRRRFSDSIFFVQFVFCCIESVLVNDGINNLQLALNKLMASLEPFSCVDFIPVLLERLLSLSQIVCGWLKNHVDYHPKYVAIKRLIDGEMLSRGPVLVVVPDWTVMGWICEILAELAPRPLTSTCDMNFVSKVACIASLDLRRLLMDERLLGPFRSHFSCVIEWSDFGFANMNLGIKEHHVLSLFASHSHRYTLLSQSCKIKKMVQLIKKCHRFENVDCYTRIYPTPRGENACQRNNNERQETDIDTTFRGNSSKNHQSATEQLSFILWDCRRFCVESVWANEDEFHLLEPIRASLYQSNLVLVPSRLNFHETLVIDNRKCLSILYDVASKSRFEEQCDNLSRIYSIVLIALLNVTDLDSEYISLIHRKQLGNGQIILKKASTFADILELIHLLRKMKAKSIPPCKKRVFSQL